MPECVGIWIDHKRAIVVTIDGDDVATRTIESGVTGRFRLSGGSRSATPWGPQDVASESKMEERHKHQLQKYYERVIESVKAAQRIFIFGPGEAKVEFRKVIQGSKDLSARIAGVETADKMTERQIVAKVRKFFAQPG
jgi:hypothetical protein